MHMRGLQVDIHLTAAATMSTWHADEHASVWSSSRVSSLWGGKQLLGEQETYPFCIDIAVGSEVSSEQWDVGSEKVRR